MAKLFLSHSSRDNPYAVALSEWLSLNGWDDVFLDFDPRRGIKGGERWEQALNEAASRCEAVVFLVSRAWLSSEWCLKEFGLAAKLNKRLLGVLIEDVPSAELPVYLTSTWQLIDLARGRQRESFTVVLPFTGESAEVSLSSEGLVRLREGLRKAGLDPNFFAWPPPDDPGRSPYPGLRPLEMEDAGVFFGREVQIIEALDHLRAVRDGTALPLLCVLGASGSGKSSFLRAGVCPRLKRDDRSFLPLPVLRPGRAATSGTSELARVLAVAFAVMGLELARADAEAAIRDGIAGVRPLLDRLAAAATRHGEDGPATPPLLVLPIDQAEELFLAATAQESAALLSLVAALSAPSERRLAVVMTIRSDAFESLQTAPQLEGIPLATLVFSPMPRGLYATLIERPAARLADTDRPLAVEPALVRALLDDMAEGGGRDVLPLLAFTLERIWLEFGASGRLTLENYETLGRVRGSIEAAVERALAAADADRRIPADRGARFALLRRGLIPWLAGIDPDTGSPRRRVARRAEIPDEALPLVDLLVEQRLLSSDVDAVTGDATIEPAHEALLRQWSLLDGWLVEDFASLATLEGVKRAAREWEANARAAAWLAHQGGRLAEAQSLDARPDIATMLDSADRAYLSACQAQETAEREALEQRRRERDAEQARRLADARKIAWRTGIGLVAALVLAVAAGVFGLVAKQQRTLADQRAEEAQTQTLLTERSREAAEAEKRRADTSAEDARRSARVAEKRLRDGQRNESASLAERSLEKDATGDTTAAIELALKALPTNYERPDRPILARAEYALEKALWDHRVLWRATPGSDRINHAALSPDGTRIAVSGRDGGLRLIDSRTGADIWKADIRRRAAFMSSFSADGRRLATSYQEPLSIVVRDVASGAVLRDIAVDGLVGGRGAIGFLSSGRIAFSGGIADTSVRLYDSVSGRAVASFPFARQITSFTKEVGEIDGGDRIFAIAPESIQVWDAASGRTFLASFETPESGTDKAAHFVSPFRDKGWEGLSDLRELEPRKRFLVRSHSTVYVIAEADRRVEHAWAYTRELAAGFVDVFLVARSIGWPRRDLVVLPKTKSDLGVFDVETGELRQTLAGHTSTLVSADLGWGGELVAASAEDGTVRVWKRETGQQIHLFKLSDAPVTQLRFTEDRRSLLAQAGSSLIMLDIRSPEDRRPSAGLEPGWQVKAVDPTGSVALAGDRESNSVHARFVDLVGGRAPAPLPDDDNLVIDKDHTVFSADGRLAAISLWVNIGNESRTAASRAALSALTAESNPDLAREIESGAITATVAVLSVADGRIVRMLPAHHGASRSLSFSPDARYLCHVGRVSGRRDVIHIGVDEVSSGRQLVASEQDGGSGECLFAGTSVFMVTRAELRWFVDAVTITGWDLTSGARRFRTDPIPSDRSAPVTSVADGRRVLIANEKRPPTLLEAETGRPAMDFGLDMIGVENAELIGPDRVRLERADKTWAVWDLASQTRIPTLAGGNDTHFLSSSRDGSIVLLRTDRGDERSVFRAVASADGRTLLETEPVPRTWTHALLDDASRTLIVPAGEATVTVYDLDRPGPLRNLALGAPYETLSLLSGGRLLLSMDKDGGLEAWDVTTGRRTAEWPSPSGKRSLRRPSGPSDRVGLIDGEAGARVVDARTGATVWQSGALEVTNLAFSNDATRVGVVSPDALVIVDLTANRILASHPLPTDGFQFASVAPDGVHAAFQSRTGAVLLIDLASGAKLAQLDEASPFAWAPQGAVFAFANGTGLGIIDAGGDGALRRVEARSAVKEIAFDPSGRALLIGCTDGSVARLDATHGTLETLTRLRKGPQWLAFAGGGAAALIHEASGLLSLWQIKDAKVLSVFRQRWSDNEVLGWKVRAARSGSYIAVIYPDKWVRVFDTATGRLLIWLNSDTPFDDALALDEATLVTLKNQGLVERFDIRQNKPLPSLRLSGAAEGRGFTRLEATPAIKFLAIAEDGSVAVVSPVFNSFDLVRGPSSGRSETLQAVLNLDATTLTTATPEGELRIWDMKAKALVAAWTFAPPQGRYLGSDLRVRLSADGRALVFGGSGEDFGTIALPLQRAPLLARARDVVPLDRTQPSAAPAPRLGVTMRPVTTSDPLPQEAANGVILNGVVPDSAAFQAGLQVGDVLVAVAGKPIEKPSDVPEAVAKAGVGGDLMIDVIRDGRIMAVVAHL